MREQTKSIPVKTMDDALNTGFVIGKMTFKDLNAFKVESAMKMVAGTARSMGINVKGNFPS